MKLSAHKTSLLHMIGYISVGWFIHVHHTMASSLSIDSTYTYVFSSSTAWSKYASSNLNSVISSGTLGGSDTLVLNGGTLKVSSSFTITNSVTLSGNSIVDTNNNILTLSGNITGNNSATFTITDSQSILGKLYVGGTNTAIPNTYVTNGAFFKITGSHSGTLNFGVGTLIANSGTNTLSNPIVLSNTAYINIPLVSDRLILTNGVSGGYSLYVTGSGVLELANGSNNSTSALINVGNGATLISDNAQDITEATQVSLSGTYDIDGDPQTLYNLTGSGTIKSGSGTGPLTVALTSDSTFNGTLQSSLTNFTLTSANNIARTLTMTGVTNSITGTTTIRAYCTYYGKLSSTKPLVINTNGTMKFSNATTVTTLTNNGTIDLNARNLTLTGVSSIGTVTDSSSGGRITLNGNTGTFTQNYSRPLTCTGGPTVKAGPNSVTTLSGAITLSSNTTLDSAGQTLMIGGAMSGAYALTITDSAASSGIVEVSSASNANITSTTLTSGIFLLSHTSFPGSFIFNGGTFRAGSTLSTLSNTVTLNANGSGIDLNGRALTLTNALTNGSSYNFTVSDSASGGSLVLGDHNTINGLVNSGNINLNGKTLTLTENSTLGTISGSTGSIVISGGVTTASVSCARNISVTNSSKLRVVSALTLGNVTLG